MKMPFPNATSSNRVGADGLNSAVHSTRDGIVDGEDLAVLAASFGGSITP
jgi:hypothetical protein